MRHQNQWVPSTNYFLLPGACAIGRNCLEGCYILLSQNWHPLMEGREKLVIRWPRFENLCRAVLEMRPNNYNMVL